MFTITVPSSFVFFSINYEWVQTVNGQVNYYTCNVFAGRHGMSTTLFSVLKAENITNGSVASLILE